MSHKAIRRKSTLKRLNSTEDRPLLLEKSFFIRECSSFIPSTKDYTRCCCGLNKIKHAADIQFFPHSPLSGRSSRLKWQPSKHTKLSPTNAYGVIEFHKSGSLKKAQYVRLAHDTNPDTILQLLLKGWHLQLPKLLISVHGGSKNFPLESKLKRAFRKGLQRAARTTSAWIITYGINSGVVQHVGDALGERSASTKNDIPVIGISPWGMVESKEQLIGLQNIANLPSGICRTNLVLDSRHTHFLLADNGTNSKSGADNFLRRRLEKYISLQKISKVNNQKVPVVCLVVEGGPFTIHMVLDYINDDPPVPVVVLDGSGRAADLIAFTYKCTNDDGVLVEEAYDELFEAIQTNFDFDAVKSEYLINQLLACVKKKELITVVQLTDSDGQELDTAIVTALLKDKHTSASDQLNWALTWGRDDIAQKQVFREGVKWPEGVLDQAMLDALTGDKVEFVQLLMDKGVNIRTFLTISKLEYLYNTKEGPANTLWHLVQSVRTTQRKKHNCHITLIDIGLVIEKLMGGSFRSVYCEKAFRNQYHSCIKQQREKLTEGNLLNAKLDTPFNHLLIWAVLMKRHKMALFIWQHGEEAMAKALMASKLNQGMADEVAEDDLDWEIYDELYKNSETFKKLALKLLKQCYGLDEIYAQQLLTYELQNWSKKTCLELAATSKHIKFISHNCCQALLSQMWLGGLQVRQHRNLKIILGILLPLTILFLDFKSKEELQYTPQTIENYIQDMQTGKTQDIDEEMGCENEDIEAYCYTNAALEESSIRDEDNTNTSSDIFELSLVRSIDVKKKTHSLKLGRKISKFYKAPITKFWFHTIVYLIFLGMFMYMVLVEMDPNIPSFSEWVVMFTVFATAIERTRDLLSSDSPDFRKKWIQWTKNRWNVWDMIAISMFYLGLILRFKSSSFHVGRFLYCVDISFWILRLLEIFSVHMYLGPYVMTIRKMIKDVCYFFVVLMVMAIAFGVARQSILNPNEPAHWKLLIDIVYEPYFMIFGELFTDHINPGCDTNDPRCTTGAWITPILMSIYLLMTYMLLVNLLIAKFNHTFAEVEKISRQLWKHNRYSLIMRYERCPLLPPPLIIINHLYSLGKFIYSFYKKRKLHWDKGLKLFLMPEDLEKLFYFEEESVNNYLQQDDNLVNGKKSNQLSSISEQTNQISSRMDEQSERNENIWSSQQTLELRMATLEEIVKDSITIMTRLTKLVTNYTEPTTPQSSSPKSSLPSASNSGRTSPTPGYIVLNNKLIHRPSVILNRNNYQSSHLENLIQESKQTNEPPIEILYDSKHLSPLLPGKIPRRMSMPIKITGPPLSSGVAQHVEMGRSRRPSLLILKPILSYQSITPPPLLNTSGPFTNTKLPDSENECSPTLSEPESFEEIEQDEELNKDHIRHNIEILSNNEDQVLKIITKDISLIEKSLTPISSELSSFRFLNRSNSNQDGRKSPNRVHFNDIVERGDEVYPNDTCNNTLEIYGHPSFDEILNENNSEFKLEEYSLVRQPQTSTPLPEILIDASNLTIDNSSHYLQIPEWQNKESES